MNVAAARRSLLPALCWQPLAALTVLSLGLVLANRAGAVHGDPLTMVRIASVLLAAGVAFALDDISAAVTDAAPRGRPVRAGARVLGIAAPAGTAWAAVVAVATAGTPHLGALTVAGAAVEAAGLAALGLALAAVLAHRAGLAEPGVAVAPAVLLSVPMLMLLPERVVLFVAPGPEWADAHLRWLVVLAVAATALAAGCADPARRRRSRPRTAGVSGSGAS